jgi:hypothetical protein
MMNAHIRLHFWAVLLLAATAAGQVMDIYIPAGFNTPFLKSGKFITSLYYYNTNTVSEYGDQENQLANYNLNLVAYVGLTDQMTLKTNFIYTPAQTFSEILAGGMGKDKLESYFSPQFVLAYRPTKSIEIFGDYFYQSQTRVIGDKSLYQDVPVGVDGDGNIIYERQLVAQPGLGNIMTRTTTFRIGISYIGSLW